MSRIDLAFSFLPAFQIGTAALSKSADSSKQYEYPEYHESVEFIGTFEPLKPIEPVWTLGLSPKLQVCRFFRKTYRLARGNLFVVGVPIILSIQLIISFFLAAFAAPPSFQASKAKMPSRLAGNQTLELTAKTSQFGIARYLISKDAVSVTTFTGTTAWRNLTPDKVIMIRPENKIYLETTRKAWIDWARRGIDLVKIKRVQKVGVEELCGRQVEHFLAFETETPVKSKLSAEFWTLPASSFNDAVLSYWCEMLDLPTSFGFPIKVKQRHEGQFVTMVNPSALKTTSSKVSDFAAPAGYRQVKDLATFYFSEGGADLRSSDLSDLFMSEKRGLGDSPKKSVGEKAK